MVPSSPYGPCSTGNTTSTSSAAQGAPAGSSATNVEPVGSTGNATADPPVTAGNCRPAAVGTASASKYNQRPAGVIPIAVTSKRSVSILASTPAPEMQDTGCSPLRPPKTTATRTRSVMSPTLTGDPAATADPTRRHGPTHTLALAAGSTRSGLHSGLC